MIGLKEKEQADAAAERKLTFEALATAQATVESGEQEAQLLRTARDLRDDRPVAAEELDAALSAYAKVTAAKGEESPAASRMRRR